VAESRKTFIPKEAMVYLHASLHQGFGTPINRLQGLYLSFIFPKEDAARQKSKTSPERVYGRANKASNAGCVGNPTLRSPQSLSSDLGERWDDWWRRRRCSKVRSPSHPRTTRETVALHCVEYLYGDFQLDLREAKQGVLADCGAAQ
jgi:hypothetical protein